ncbi:MAG: Rieske 2Fe-2S domain-containing protein [Bacteroidota bacterium]
MIRNQWYVVLESAELRKAPLGVVRMGEKLVFWRDSENKVHCLPDRCSHRRVQLSLGEVVDGRLQCPFHGLQFDGQGKCCLIPANGRNAEVPERFSIEGYETREMHGFIWIFWGERNAAEGDPAYFTNIDGSFHYLTRQDPWAVHYSRVIENQLDVVHLPFIHKKTIGRGGKTLVDGPKTRWTDNQKFHLYVYNRHDDGTSPKKPSELPDGSDEKQHLEFIFPNLWQNYLTPKMRIVAAFVPVDEENTLMYIRFFQKFIKLPPFRELLTWLFMPMNLRIAHEDRRVVITHEPKKSSFRSKENLIQGDIPVIEYRKRRQELMDGKNAVPEEKG